MKTEARAKNVQERGEQPQAQQQKRPSVLLMEVQTAVAQQQQLLQAQLSILTDLAKEVRDLKSAVQSLRVQLANPMVQPYEDDNEDELYDESLDDQEDGDEVISSFVEPEPASRLRRAAQPVEPTSEGPKPLLLMPDVPAARLNGRRQEGTR